MIQLSLGGVRAEEMFGHRKRKEHGRNYPKDR
jgi:hypothetical protein